MSSHRLPSIVIFLGSFLLFGVQPMLGRTLLPSFGGTAAVWVVCLCAYQILLLAGYGYAHVTAGSPSRRRHFVLLACAVVWTLVLAYFRPALRAHIGNSGVPALEVLLCVLVFAGLPYVLLSANSSLIQAWVVGSRRTTAQSSPSETTGARDSRSIYGLYAVSNAGSFCGLLFYPFILEPYVSLTAQWWGFAVCLALYAALLARVAANAGAPLASRPSPATGHRSPVTDPCSPSSPSATRQAQPSSVLLWFVLPALSVFLLNAVTARLSLDVMALPLLWVLLLGLFLLSYVLGFSERAKRLIGWYEAGALGCLVLAALVMQRTGGPAIFVANLAAGIGLVLAGCAFLHSWLYQTRPSDHQATRFYLANAVGGAVGGIVSSLIAPLLFRSVAEYPIALLLLLGSTVVYGWAYAPKLPVRVVLPRVVYIPLAAVILGVMAFQSVFEDTKGRVTLARNRGFFGTVEVTAIPAAAETAAPGSLHEFVHGATVHGMQARIAGKERMTTAYYTPDAGGVAVLQHPKYKQGKPMRIGLIGTGVGVMLGYCRTNDLYRCYEINKQVIGIATNPAFFSYVQDAPGTVEFRIGDARKALERESAAREPLFDVLILDALTGDNIPAHLSTREAFQLYFERLAPDGVLAVNISNWHLDLLPLVRAVSDAFKMPTVALMVEENLGKLQFSSSWAFMMREPPAGFTFPQDALMLSLQKAGGFRLPTDEKGSFIPLIRW